MSEEPARSEAEMMIAEAKKALFVMVGLLALLWLVQIVNAVDDYDIGRDLGIQPRDPASLPDVLTSPFMHYGWGHIEANSGPLFIFGFLAAYRGVKKWFGVSLLIIVASGLGVWFTAPSNTVTVGASGLLFGYFGYVIVRGLFDRHPIDIVLGLVMALCFAYQFTSLLPTDERVSWQGHLFGFVGGIIGGWIFRDRRPKTVAAPDPATALLPKDLS
ncbi:rhomboid family intramembrane serine protease [Amycolatopsis sp. NPDC004625]|uniref:rhomboid family intramembrane serine protease n=1 Tax=Amycolatopsis sp. NPDC004625 TaxID=3154670 RepID=UPI0033AFF05D